MPKTKTKKIRDHATDLADKVAPTVESARDKAAPLIADARDKAAPLVADARDKAGPALAAGKERLTTDVLPVITAAIVAAGEATEDVRGETKKRGKAAVAALKGEVEAPEKKTHRVRKALILLGLGGIIAAVAKKLSDRPATTAWQSSYTPTPSAPAAASGTSGGAHKADNDQGGASPDVAAADAAAEPHEATTPDNPAETIDVSKN
jgi:hypothetical protein